MVFLAQDGEGKFTEAIEAQKKALTYNQADNVIYGLAQRYAQAGETRPS